MDHQSIDTNFSISEVVAGCASAGTVVLIDGAGSSGASDITDGAGVAVNNGRSEDIGELLIPKNPRINAISEEKNLNNMICFFLLLGFRSWRLLFDASAYCLFSTHLLTKPSLRFRYILPAASRYTVGFPAI